MKDVKNTKIKFAVLATDVILLSVCEDKLMVRLLKVERPPHFDGVSGLPGGLIKPNETAEHAVLRLIKEKAKVDPAKVYLEQLYTFSEIKRDPRGRVVSVAYLALVPWENLTSIEKNDSVGLWWENVHLLSKLAYDHDEMIDMAIKRLRSRVTYTTLSGKLIPYEFTLTELESAVETVLGKDIDKRNFRKKILKIKIVKKLDKERRGLKHRPASLYVFVSEKVKDIEVL